MKKRNFNNQFNNGKNKRPLFKERLYVVCEGFVDKMVLNHILNSITLKYEVIIEPSGSKNNIFKTYKSIKSIHHLSEVLIFIDLDGNGSTNIDSINIDFKRNGFKKPKIIYFVNPVIEYFFISAKENRNSSYTKKEDYKPDIKRLYGIDSYTGTQDECNRILKFISNEECIVLIERLSRFDKDIYSLPSTNLLDLLDFLRNDEKWYVGLRM